VLVTRADRGLQSFCTSGVRGKLAGRGRAEVDHHTRDHFDVWLDEIVDSQLAFLTRKLAPRGSSRSG
jgi:hypothetical protein